MNSSGINRFVILFVLFYLINGCAFVDQDIKLTYSQTVNATGGHGKVVIARPESEISKNAKGQYIIGDVKNSWGMTTADTVTSDYPGDWIALALKTELTHAGYEVILLDSIPDYSPKALQVIINKIWAGQDVGMFTVGANTEISFNVKIYKHGHFIDTISAQEDYNPRSMISSAGQKGEALHYAIQECMRKVIPKIINSLEN